MTWWAGFWNWIASLFGYDIWVWGSAADWFAAIGTVGALLLGLALLRNDRRQKERELAEAVTSWYAHVTESNDDPDDIDSSDLQVTVHNSGSRPAVSVRVRVEWDEGGHSEYLETAGENAFIDETIRPQLLPEESVTFGRLAFGGIMNPKFIYLHFQDGNGIPWVKNLTMHRMRRADRDLNWFQERKWRRDTKRFLAQRDR